MGIGLSFIEFFDLCYRQDALRSPMIALGLLKINDSEEAVRGYIKENPHWNDIRDVTVRSIFSFRYQVNVYRDCDLNQAADFKLDLNAPLDPAWRDSAMTVLNAGTIEHVFDVGQSINTMHDLTRSGGTIIHIVPLTWYEHGYYNFNPRLFRMTADSNGYVLLAEAYDFSWAILHDTTGLQPQLYITFDGQAMTIWNERIAVLARSGRLPANALYLVAYRKVGAREFVCPYDLS